MSEMPGEEDEVIARTPAAAAPSTMFIAATSLSACRQSPPACGRRFAMYSETSDCGVIG